MSNLQLATRARVLRTPAGPQLVRRERRPGVGPDGTRALLATARWSPPAPGEIRVDRLTRAFSASPPTLSLPPRRLLLL